VKRQQRINLADQLLEVIDDLAMPGQGTRAAVNVRRLVDFILLETTSSRPPGTGSDFAPG